MVFITYVWSHASNVHVQLPNGTRSRLLPGSPTCTFIICVYLAMLHCRVGSSEP